MKNNQYTFKLSPHDSYNIDDFILSSSNVQAYNILNDWPLRWGHLPFVNSILLHSPPSSGKTYLAKIWQEKSEAYLINDSQPFNEKVVEECQNFVIEDIERWNEQKLLHYFNLINEKGKYLLLTTSTLQNNFQLKDIDSRINSILKVKIEAPDDDMIRIFLFKLFSEASLKPSAQVQEYLLSRLPRQFNEIISFVNRANEIALKNKRNLTVPLIKEIMALSVIG